MTIADLLTIYRPLLGWTLIGWVSGRLLPAAVPTHLGKFLFWVGVPVSIAAFLRHAHLSAALWLAPTIAWIAMLLGVGCAWWWSQRSPIANLHTDDPASPRSPQTRGSFLLAAMLGNTGYIGYPVALALVGPHYFAWTLFYDLLGSTPGAYGLGVAIAARFSDSPPSNRWQALQTMLKNPALWSFAIGIAGRNYPLPAMLETSLHNFAWAIVALSLILIGMRLSQLSALQRLRPALISLGIKMLLVPLVLGLVLWALGVTGFVYRALLLQMAMPPAFATLVIAEAYELDQEFAVTTLVTGCFGLLILLPFWIWLFNIAGIR